MLTNTQEILDQFHTLIGDSTEMSSEEELKLLNKIYFEVLRAKQWEFLKKEASGSLSGIEIAQPSDFSNLTDDLNIYIGEYSNPFKVIPFNERRLYVNQNNFCYYDARQQKFIFFKEQNNSYSFDYIYVPSKITLSVYPVFPNRFWDMLPYFMAADSDFISLVEKARSYSAENRSLGEKILSDMKSWNDNISMIQTYGS